MKLVMKFLQQLLMKEKMSKMHLKYPEFTYSAFGPFIKNEKSMQKFKETEDSAHIYKIDLDKAYFQHDMAFGDFKDLAGRTDSDKVLGVKAFYVAKSPKYGEYQRRLASMVYIFL